MNVAGRPRPGHNIQEPKCIRCIGIDDTYDPVTCWRRSEDVICLRYQRWIAGGGQFDLAGHQDVVQVNKQHRRLIRCEIGTRKGTRKLGWYKQALFVLAWFRDRAADRCLLKTTSRKGEAIPP